MRKPNARTEEPVRDGNDLVRFALTELDTTSIQIIAARDWKLVFEIAVSADPSLRITTVAWEMPAS